MTIANLKIIGERINPGFKSTKRLFDQEDMAGIQALAADQVAKGASILSINVGTLAVEKPEFMVEVIRRVQDVVAVPLAFDFPNFEVQELCLKTYDREKAGGALPIVNSISELRWEMLDLLKICRCRFVLMASERRQDGRRVANKTADEVHQTARRMALAMVGADHGLIFDDLFVDVSIAPIGTDTEGLTRMAVNAIRAIGADPDLAGIHMTAGLSNISIMLPRDAADGTALKPQLESAFLTLTVPHGLDTVIGTAGRDYALLPEDNLIMRGVREFLELDGFDALMQVQKLYRRA